MVENVVVVVGLRETMKIAIVCEVLRTVEKDWHLLSSDDNVETRELRG